MNIKIEDLIEKLEQSYDFMQKATKGFAERNEQIFYRKPPAGEVDSKMDYSELVDNTLSSYIEKTPKNVIQRLPTFTVDAHAQSKVEDLKYEYIANKIILRNNTPEGYSLLQKHWIALRNAMAFGACAVYLPFTRNKTEFTVGFEIIFWGDLFPEAYASSINSANYIQFRTMKTKTSIEKLINGTDKGDAEDGKWNIEGLKKVLEFGKGASLGREETNRTYASLLNIPEGLYELFVYVDDDWIITYHYQSATILRVVKNTSGYRRVLGLYSDFDGINIMGRSLVEMGYGAQQALTSLLRNFIYTVDYNTEPAKFVKGIGLDEDNFELEKGNTMFLNDEDGSMQLLPIDTTVIQNFPSLFSLVKSVLLSSLPSSNDSSISAEVGDPTYSKTQAGVNSQDRKADIENNYYRKNYEQFFEAVLEAQINIYISEIRKIAEANEQSQLVIKLDSEYINLIEQEDPSQIINGDSVIIDTSKVQQVNISVDFESTRQMAKEEDLKRLNTFMTGFFEVAKADPSVAKGVREALPYLIEELTKSSNLESSSKIAEAVKAGLETAKQEEAEQAQLEQQAQQAQQQPAQMAEIKAPSVSIAFKDLPPAGKIQAAAKYGIQLTEADVTPQPAYPQPEEVEYV